MVCLPMKYFVVQVLTLHFEECVGLGRKMQTASVCRWAVVVGDRMAY
jgi:hypothetical protein